MVTDRFGTPEVVLGDGTWLKADIAQAGNAIWLYIRDADDPYNSVARLSALLGNPAALTEITRLLYGQSKVYTGFTRLTNVKEYEPGMACARLQREA